MDSNKLIINGIDVSECNFRLEREGKQKCECTHATGFGVICDCENWHNCYFKQLKRLQEENENLKYEIDRHKDTIYYLNNRDMCLKTLIKYKQTLEKINEIVSDRLWHDNKKQIKNIINEALNDRD